MAKKTPSGPAFEHGGGREGCKNTVEVGLLDGPVQPKRLACAGALHDHGLLGAGSFSRARGPGI